MKRTNEKYSVKPNPEVTRYFAYEREAEINY